MTSVAALSDISPDMAPVLIASRKLGHSLEERAGDEAALFGQQAGHPALRRSVRHCLYMPRPAARRHPRRSREATDVPSVQILGQRSGWSLP